MNSNYEQFDTANEVHHRAGRQIAEWSATSQSMIPLSLEAMAGHPFGYLAFTGEEIAGYAAITVSYTEKLCEFGGLVVNEKMRGQGIGKNLTRTVLGKVPQHLLAAEQVIAFANEQSGPLFKKYVGARALSQPELCGLSKDVWKLCLACPAGGSSFDIEQPACCDRVVDLTAYVEAAKNRKADREVVAILEHR